MHVSDLILITVLILWQITLSIVISVLLLFLSVCLVDIKNDIYFCEAAHVQMVTPSEGFLRCASYTFSDIKRKTFWGWTVSYHQSKWLSKLLSSFEVSWTRGINERVVSMNAWHYWTRGINERPECWSLVIILLNLIILTFFINFPGVAELWLV